MSTWQPEYCTGEGGREGGREGQGEGKREGRREGGREGGREGRKEGGREGEREGGKEWNGAGMRGREGGWGCQGMAVPVCIQVSLANDPENDGSFL